MEPLKKPIVTEVFTDNGGHSHWTLIDPETGAKLWSEDPEECKAMGYAVVSNGDFNFTKVVEQKEVKVLPAIIQSAFKFANGKRIIIYTGNDGIKTFECDEKWEVAGKKKKPYAKSPLVGETAVEYHRNIRLLHTPEDYVPEHSTSLEDLLI